MVITTRAYDCEMETPHATGPVAPGLEDEVARLIARACGTVEPAGAAHTDLGRVLLRATPRLVSCAAKPLHLCRVRVRVP